MFFLIFTSNYFSVLLCEKYEKLKNFNCNNFTVSYMFKT